MPILFTAIALVFAMAGCSTTVKLSVKNDSSYPQRTKVLISDKKGFQESESIELGTIQPSKSIPVTFKVKDGGKFTVEASLPRSGKCFTEVKTVTGDPDPLAVSVTLDLQGGNCDELDEKNAAEVLAQAFGTLGPNRGFAPIPVYNALNSIFGALLVMTPPTAQNASSTVHFILKPGKFAPAIKYGDFRFPTNNLQTKSRFTGSKTVSLAASAPIYGSLGINVESDEVYELSADMTGFGVVHRPGSSKWNYIDAFDGLSKQIKNRVFSAIEENPGAVLMFVDRMYVVKNSTFKVTKAKKLSNGVEASAGSIVTAGGAWTFEGQSATTRLFSDSVVNIDGIVFTVKRPEESVNPDLNLPSDSIADWSGLRAGDGKMIHNVGLFELPPQSLGEVNGYDLESGMMLSVE
jgi:hypothetical protein